MRYITGLLFIFVLQACHFKDIYLCERSEFEQQGMFDFLETKSQISRSTHNFINSRLLEERLKKDPREVLDKLATEFEQKKSGLNKQYDEELLFALTDLALVIAHHCKDKDDALRYYATSARCASRYINLFISNKTINAFDPSAFYIVRVYNMATKQMFELLEKKGLTQSNSYTIVDIFNNPISFKPCVYTGYLIPPKYISEYIPCAKYKVENINQINYKYGIGVPLIAVIDDNTPPYGVANFHENLSLPVSVVLHFKGNLLTGNEEAYFNFYWSDVESLQMGGNQYQIEQDFSTPIAYQFRKNSFKKIIEFTINPEALGGQPEGLYLMEPFSPNRIPVIFVHGLLSSPPTWAQMINTLRADPEIRKRYQFIFYSYSSGSPILYSAARFRSKLKTARQQIQENFCDTALKNFDNMVVVGHSMGGLLTKAQISYADSSFVNLFPDSSYEMITKNIDSKRLQELHNTITFLPSNSIRRVLFLATPHKGSHLAEWGITNFLAKLITLPSKLIEAQKTINDLKYKGNVPNRTLVQLATGVGNLAPSDIVLQTLDSLQLKKEIPFHSIIGNTNKAIPGGSDTIVPYESSHKEGAESELVIQSGHSVQVNPLAILEVKRILIQHLEELQNPLRKKGNQP